MGIPWKLIGVLGGAAAAAALLLAGLNWVRGANDARACVANVAAKAGQRDLSRCAKPVRAVMAQAEQDADTAARATACAEQIRLLPATREQPAAWVVPLVCPKPVQQLAADQAARAGEVRSRDAELARLKADRSAAINRAAARAAAQARGEADAARIIPTLPSAGPDRHRCDAECLRRLAGG